MMPAFSPCCQQSPPTIRGIKGETGSDMTNNKSAGSLLPSRESLGSSCLSPSCALMSRGRAGDGFALCFRASSGDETCRSVAFPGKTLPSQTPKKPPSSKPACACRHSLIQRMEKEEGWGWMAPAQPGCRNPL